MTLQNLNKILDKYEQQLGIAGTPSSPPQQLELLKGLPFYTEWQVAAPSVQKEAQKSSLSFNHVIGLPKKNEEELQLFDYERLLFNTLENHKHVWIKKATGHHRIHATVYGLVMLKRCQLSWRPDAHSHRVGVKLAIIPIDRTNPASSKNF